MPAPRPGPPPGLLRALPGLVVVALLAAAPARAAGDSEIAAVYSKVARDYVRARLPDGTPKPETYSLGEGGLLNRPQPDASIDRVKFLTIARLLGGPLAQRHYRPATDPRHTDLLIMVYWGTTGATAGGTTASTAFQGLEAVTNAMSSAAQAPPPPPPPPPSGPGGSTDPIDHSATLALASARQSEADSQMAMIQLQNGEREQADLATARLLGYTGELSRLEDHEGTALRTLRQDIIEEVEEGRYFVILVAYDFQRMWKDHQPRPRWITRFSIRERGNDFGEKLGPMVQYASKYFGEDSGGLVRRPLRTGKVDYGELRVIDSDVKLKK